MSRKLILALAIGGAIYYQFGRKKGEGSTASDTSPDIIMPPNADSGQSIFTKYDNRIVADMNGYWMLIKKGKIYSPTNQASLDSYVASNPGIPFLTVNEDIWKYHSENFPEVFGGAF